MLDADEEVVKGRKSTGKELSKNRQANDGWLVAASHDMKRKRVKRSHDEYSEPAVTDFCTGLVVRSETDIKVSNNFKKNSIIPGSKMLSFSQIRLVSVLPQDLDSYRLWWTEMQVLRAVDTFPLLSSLLLIPRRVYCHFIVT